jgi:long-subunit acyl-CoA synthetase (AMP-forming)
MTESSPVCHCMTSLEAAGRTGSVGRLLPTFQARLVTEDGTDAAEGERGELWLRGPSIMMGYHRNPEATAKTMYDDWLKTGDVLVRTKDGWYT